MSAAQFNCPTCGAILRAPEAMAPGSLVRCPTCKATFPVPSAPGEPDAGYRAEPGVPSGYADEAAADETAGFQPRRGLDGLTSNYSIELNDWFDIAKKNYSAVLGPMIGYIMIFVAVALAYGMCVGLLRAGAGRGGGEAVMALDGCFRLVIQIFVVPPLQAGGTIVCLHQIMGRRWSFGDFFSGFRWWGTLILNQLLLSLISIGCVLPAMIVALAFILPNQKNQDMVLLGVLLAIVAYLPFIYVLIRVSYFCVPLIVDRDCGPMEAIQGSWLLTRGHFIALFGISLLMGLIMLAGCIACGIGALFTAPFVALTTTAGYVLIAGSRPPVERRVLPASDE